MTSKCSCCDCYAYPKCPLCKAAPKMHDALREIVKAGVEKHSFNYPEVMLQHAWDDIAVMLSIARKALL